MEERTELSSGLEGIAWALLTANSYRVIIIDLNGIVLSVNGSAAKYPSGLSNEQVGTCIWDSYPKTKLNHHKVLINQVAETGQPITFNQKDNGQWDQVLIYPVQGENSQVERIAICTHEITEQINAEEQLKQVLLQLITAQEDERHRISQDLHDEVGQKMTALVFELRMIKNSIENEQKVTLEEINRVIRNMEIIIKHVRQTFYKLYPPSLHRIALQKVLAAFCTTYEETNKIQVDFSYQEKIPELPDKYGMAIYRFVQEGLTNVTKHANASSVWINLDYSDSEISISLEDNGSGIDLLKMTEGIGLRGIRERFSVLGGSIEVEAILGKGTRLSGTIPFNTINF